MVARVLIATCLMAAAISVSAQSDLDDFMSRVLERRDENWKKLQQYILEERETLQVVGPAGAPLYGLRRDYTWFVRQGYFIRSPIRANGVAIAESERRRAEDEWMQREQRRERRQAERENAAAGPPPETPATPETIADVLRQSVEPGFVSAAYFMKFKFDPGQYALAGREQLDGREVLRIEYYPTKLFNEGRTRPNRRARERDEEIEEKMNKSSLVTLWIDSAAHQILRYEFDNPGLDFLPGRSFMRIDALRASMHMGQPFPDVWLPRTIEMRFDVTMAVGSVQARYDVEYHEYRLPSVTTRVR